MFRISLARKTILPYSNQALPWLVAERRVLQSERPNPTSETQQIKETVTSIINVVASDFRHLHNVDSYSANFMNLPRFLRKSRLGMSKPWHSPRA